MCGTGTAAEIRTMWFMIFGAAAAAGFWLFVFDSIERRKSR
jgi:hypothetical protein